MAWIITEDRITDAARGEKSRVGWHSRKWNLDECPLLSLAAYAPHEFRMLDDDGEVYYLGRSTVPDSFAPLDDLGTPDAGATTIQYRRDGRWETL